MLKTILRKFYEELLNDTFKCVFLKPDIKKSFLFILRGWPDPSGGEQYVSSQTLKGLETQD